MDHHRFDEIARQLAGGASRRMVLRGILGGAVGLLGVRRVDAQNGCAAFCRDLPPGRQRGRCRSDCAHGTGLFFACEGDASRLCAGADGSLTCCPANQPCVDGACQPPPPPGCTSDAECDDGDLCTDDTCLDGQCVNTPIPDCGGTGTCDCTAKRNGEACGDDTECCSGTCGGLFGSPVCGRGEGCSGGGGYCEANGDCCSGMCEGCRCACLANGDPTCSANRECCGGICGPNGCCGRVDRPCADNDDCCSGVCTGGSCDRGPAGTPCDSAGGCDSIECCEGICCNENEFCGYDATTNTFGCEPYP